MKTALRGWGRRLRWARGRGWRAADFSARYADPARDAWGYAASPEHIARADAIVAALPAARFGRVLEVGCAQGFLTERLAALADSLVACDFSPEAAGETRRRMAHAPHVEVHVADIRAGFPGTGFDLVLFSDVLYYLSKRETDLVLEETARRIARGGYVVIASEWRAHATGLTEPAYALDRLDAAPRWTRGVRDARPFGAGELVLAAYRFGDPPAA